MQKGNNKSAEEEKKKKQNSDDWIWIILAILAVVVYIYYYLIKLLWKPLAFRSGIAKFIGIIGMGLLLCSNMIYFMGIVQKNYLKSSEVAASTINKNPENKESQGWIDKDMKIYSLACLIPGIIAYLSALFIPKQQTINDEGKKRRKPKAKRKKTSK